MAIVNTGIKRSLTVTISKMVGSTVIYTHTYYGQNVAPYTVNSGLEITDTALALMSDVEFTVRLAILKSYIDTQNTGINWNNDIISGSGPSESDLTYCVLPTTTTTSTTSTTLPPTTTTTSTTQVPPSTTTTTLPLYYGHQVKTSNDPTNICFSDVFMALAISPYWIEGLTLYNYDINGQPTTLISGTYIVPDAVTDIPVYNLLDGVLGSATGYTCYITTTTTTIP